MAEKRPKSILSSLKTMLHREPEKPSAPATKAPKGPAVARKKSASPPAEKSAPAAPPAEAPAEPEAASEAKPEKKKLPNQPWYRHRQRW